MAPTVGDLSDPYGYFMRNPRPGGDRVCPRCFGFKRTTYNLCRPCSGQPAYCDAIVPITYSLNRGQMHLALRDYKDGQTNETRRKFTLDLAAVLWRFLDDHERCVAAKAGVGSFDVVTIVPPGKAIPDRPRVLLREIVGRICVPTASRYRETLVRTTVPASDHQYTEGRFDATETLAGDSVLLIDDTWTTGASVQDAARALKQAGASAVGHVALGRHVGDAYEDHNEIFDGLPKPFDWNICAVHNS